MPVARAAELRRWIDSGAYARILGGDYPRRDDDGDASVSEDVKAAADVVPGGVPATRRIRWSGCCASSATAPPTWATGSAARAGRAAGLDGRGRRADGRGTGGRRRPSRTASDAARRSACAGTARPAYDRRS